MIGTIKTLTLAAFLIPKAINALSTTDRLLIATVRFKRMKLAVFARRRNTKKKRKYISAARLLISGAKKLLVTFLLDQKSWTMILLCMIMFHLKALEFSWTSTTLQIC